MKRLGSQSREHPIQQKFPPNTILNNTTVHTLGNSEQVIEVFPPEIFFKDIEPNQSYEVTVSVRNISKKVRRIKFVRPKTNKFRIDYEPLGPVAAGLAVKMNVTFESDADGDFHDVVEIACEDQKESYKLYLHATRPAPDIQFEPLVNFKFLPVNTTKTEEIEFKNEGPEAGNITLEMLPDPNGKKSGELSIEPKTFSLDSGEQRRVKLTMTSTEPDFIMKLIQVKVEGQDRVRNIEVTATSVEHNLSIVFQEGGGQKSSLNFGTLYMGERREYPAFLVNNGPKAVPFNFKFLQGLRNLEDEQEAAQKTQYKDENLVSPATAGKEQTERVLTTEPLQGMVGAYSQVPIKFVCRTKKYEKIGGFSDHAERTKPTGEKGAYAGPSEEKYAIKPEEYASMALITFPGATGSDKLFDDLKVQMMARACYPDIKISRQNIAFGDCPANDRRDYNLTIKNKNEDLAVDFNFTKAAHFHAYPAKGKLLPGTEHTINISFEPKNMGVFNNISMDLELLSGLYRIPIKLQGSCSKAAPQSKTSALTRGPAAQPEDFSPSKTYVDEYQADSAPTRGTFKRGPLTQQGEIPKWLSDTTTMGLDSDMKIDNTEKIDQLMVIRQNKTKFNDFVTTQRLQREEQQRVTQKMKSTGKNPPQTLEEFKNDVDLGLAGGLADLDPPNLPIPNQIDSLYVEKPIGNYEPYPHFKARKRLGAESGLQENKIIKKKWKPEPTTQTEIRECAVELTGEQLQKINAGPQLIDFKTVFVKSTTTKSFVVTNDLRQHIHVRLVIADKELMKTSPVSQVIPPGQEAGFDITFCSDAPQAINFKKDVTYYVNEHTPFKFRVQAQAEPVTLDISKKVLKFQFPDDCMDMSITENIVITNTGNATAKFKWITSGTGVFVPNPAFDEVPAGSSRTAKITFTPPGPKSEEEIITLKIEDGLPVDIKCTGIVYEAKCQLKEKAVDFEQVSVGIKAKEQPFHIKNTIRVPAVFNVQCDSEELTIVPSKGRIMADQLQVFNVGFISHQEKDFNAEITLNIRGAKPIKVPIHATAIVPQVRIEEDQLDFGGVTFGDAKIIPVTIANKSNIEAKLILDLRDYPEFEISVPRDLNDKEDITSEIIVPITDQTAGAINYNDLDEVNPEDIKDPLNEDGEDGEESDDDEEEQNRYVQINVKAGQPLVLNLKYTPADVDDLRSFILPMKLAGVGEVSGLQRQVKGVGVKPRFLVEPTLVNFKTKVIAKGSKPMPFHQDITISNPDLTAISWAIDRDLLEKSKVFQMNPIEGKLDPGASSSVRVTFNPLEPLEYNTRIPVYIDGDRTKAYLMIEFKGEGQEAKIYFDRREIILPCVPLGFQAKCTFIVQHNGYENLELRPKIATEVGKLPITLNFPDGKNLGVTKQKLKVEAIFQNKKPLSFTTFIDFYDDEGNKFSIPISGTTDNSLFTVFSFIQRNQDEISLEFGGGKPINLVQDASSDKESGVKGGFGSVPTGGKQFSKQGGSSVISRNAKSIIGYNPVAAQVLERNCEQIVRWFNATMTTSSSMQNFPSDIISQNGSQIYELVAFLSGKKPPGQAPKNIGTGKDANIKDTLKILMTQYEELINFLKVNGAHLNTVRPEYLLSITDYSKYLKLNPREENMKPKTIDRIFPYISMDAWMTVFYQVLRIYYLNRVTGKSFKALPGMPNNESSVDQSMQQSNIYSVSETILLKWMQYHYNKVNPMHPKTISNFDADLQDSLVFASLIKSHYGPNSSKNIKEMKSSVFNEEQVLLNATKLIAAVHEIGLSTHLTPQDIGNPSARELLLFVIQLYQGLPHYIPKAQIEFPAVLGDLVTKNIELSNPSKNPISYWVKLDGCADFQIEDDNVRIEPGTTVNFPIKFQSRISNPVTGKVIFTNKKEGNIQAAAMVFEMISNVYERNSVDKIEKTTKLYKAAQVDLEVHNPFPSDVIFNIQIIYDKSGKNAPAAAGGKKAAPQAASTAGPSDRGSAKGGAPSQSDPGSKAGAPAGGNVQLNKYGLPEAFTCKLDSIKVRKNSTVNVPLLFLPFELGIHKAFVVFVDENVGELQYTLIGKAELPEVMDSFTENCNAEETFQMRKVLNFKNDKMEQAKNQVLDKVALAKLKDMPPQPQFDGKGRPINLDQRYFEIEISHPSFSGSSSIILNQDQPGAGGAAAGKDKKKTNEVTPKGGAPGQKGASTGALEQALNVFEMTVNPTKPATYPCFVILKSLDRTDIRLYEFKVNAIPQKIKAQLEFKVPARGSVTQEIPIVNNSQKEWTVTAALDQIKGGSFSLARNQITVKKGTTENFLLSFKPNWVCNITGMLTLHNKNTGEVYEYELKGIGEEPLAEDHIVLNCKARETTKHFFEIKNATDKPQNYTVWTDLQNAVGKKEFTLKPKETFKYELTITPLLGGVYTASITFQDNEERFMWWTVEVRTDSPKPEATIDLKSFIRKATTAEISLNNPLNEPITFEVFYSGEGLLGDASLSLEPKSIGTYSLIYSPLKSGVGEGTIGFLNERVGEFWYDLNLCADENPVVNLDTLACELGKLQTHNVNLENPTGQEMVIDVRNSNATNFEIIPDKPVLQPYETLRVSIQYSPSNLDVVETGNIIFENPHIGKWEYNVAGKGLLPTIMEPQPISTAVGNNTSSMLTFKNPFREPSTVNVTLEADDQKIFSLLLKRNKFNIGPLAILQIPYSFSPQTMTESKATIVISMSKQLVWRYPLRGIAESASTAIDYHFKGKCRKPLEETLAIALPGFEQMSASDTFRFEMNVLNPQFKGFVDRAVFFEQKSESRAGGPLEFKMRFEPLRPFKTNVEFIVYKSSGGRWKFNMIFEAVDPEVDDVITIQSPLHKTSSVSFKLTNHLKAFAEFTAYFTADSAAEFVVYPKTGLLEPYGKEGTNFIVSFTPTEYGKAKVGRLVIQTDEMQWTYEIRGSHPHYKIPEVGGGRIQNKLSKEVAEVIKQKQGEKKNFLRENLKTSKYALPGTAKEHSPGRGKELMGGASVANMSAKGHNRSKIGMSARELSNERSVHK